MSRRTGMAENENRCDSRIRRDLVLEDSLVSKESQKEYKQRWRSIRILYATMFFDSLSFSIVLSSIWPYMKKINPDPNLSPVYAGWANVGFQLAGILMDFVMGVWTNRRGSTEPLLGALFLFALGNLLYGYAQACGTYGIAMVIFSRAVIGLSTGTNVVTRVVAAEATTLKERTKVMAHMSIAQGLGFSFGPAIQLASVPLGDDGIYIESLRLHLDLYTAPAFVSVVVAILNVTAVLVWYKEFHVDIYHDSQDDHKIDSYRQLLQKHGAPKIKIDKKAILATLFLYFVVQNAFALHETIFTPLAMDQFAWTRSQATLWVGIIFFIAGCIAVFTFAITDVLEKKINDRKLLLFGFILTFIGFTVYLPWGNNYPKLKQSVFKNTIGELNTNNTVLNTTAGHQKALVDFVGCPEEYTWCHDTPQMHLSQLVLGMLCLSVGYPLVMVLTTSIYSKIIGPKPQGLLQSWLAAVGGVARTAGPALVTYMYVLAGPRWTFLTVDGFLIAALLVIAVCYKRLVPYHLMVLKKNKNIISTDIEKNQMLSRLQSCSSAETYLEDANEILTVV
ncbi:major facilitator superfamily domain-containing protein 8-like isoform X3 [Clytia hemisphaerica]|uniref:Major facilitator superfamily (MFS) profile domain-containing protein n=1 Tax=Clytia hemisphaerica TaxID=252671 RepID=A0A7M6DMM0_9CNID